MTFQQAVRILSSSNPQVQEIEAAAVERIVIAVKPFIIAPAADETTLDEWIAAGEFDGSETPQSLADEWNEVTRQARGW